MSYAGLGALSEQQKTTIAGMLPRYYSLEFEQCWQDEENPGYPNCNELNAMYEQLSEEDQEEMDDLVDELVPIYSEKEMLTHGLIVAGGSLMVGVLLGVVFG